MTNQTSLLAVVCLLGAGLAAPAGAASLTYTLDRAIGIPDGNATVQVTLTDGASGGVDFDVTLLAGSEPLPDGAGITEFAFNIAPGADVWFRDITGLEAGWKAKPRARNGFGLFDAAVRAKQATLPVTNLQFSVRPDDGTSVSLADLVSLSIGRAPEGHSLFSARLAGMEDGIVGASRVLLGGPSGATVVPLPASLWLLASALGMVGVMKRRLHG
jgi:hypothetical protein